MDELKVCFYSGDMETVLDQTLPPRFGGAEWRTYITARALAKDAECVVSLAVDTIPNRITSQAGMRLRVMPEAQPPRRESKSLTLIAKTLKRLNALTKPTPERERRLDNIRRDPPINTYGILEKYLVGIHNRVNRRRWADFVRETESTWHVVWGSSSLAYEVTRTTKGLSKRSAIWLSSDIDVDWDRPDKDRESTELYQWTLRNADLVLAQHEGQRAELALIGVESEILPTGIDISADTGHKDRDCILWVASCQRLKQPEFFLELARRLPHVPHVMIMTRRPWSAEYYDEIVAEAEGIPNLEIVDGVPDVRPYYDRAAALVNMSTVEGFPTTFLEAAVSSTPVAALNVDPDGMLSGGAGLTCNGDLELLVRAVQELYGNAEARTILGATARAYVAERHDIVEIAAKLKTLMRA